MTTRIIPVTPVDATAHVYRVTSGQVVGVLDECCVGWIAAIFRPHADGLGFTLAEAPAGQVWVKIERESGNVVGLGSLGALSGLDLSSVKLSDIQPGRLAQGARYFGSLQSQVQSEACASDDKSALALVAELRGLREDLDKLRANMSAVAASIVAPYK